MRFPAPPLAPWLLSALCLLAAPAHADTDRDPADARAEFSAAYANPTLGSSTDSDALRAYPLYSWLQAARLKSAINATDVDGAITAFLADAGDAPYGRDLRRAWLGKLAAGSNWQGFLAAWRDSASNDELACRRLDARRATGDSAGMAAELAQRWVKEDALPPACAASLAWLQSQPVYTADLIEQRLRARLLDNDATEARNLLKQLPEARRKRYDAWLKLLANPAGEFKRLAQATTPQAVDSDGLIDVWARWSRNAPSDAAALLPALISAQGLSLTVAETLRRDTALALSWNRDPAALALFKGLSDQVLDERSHEWRIRAALWAGDWNQALNWLSVLPDNLAAQSRWRYWTARALEALDQGDEAENRYLSLMRENDCYGLQAAWRVGRSWLPNNVPTLVSPSQRNALRAFPAVIRAREAWTLELKPIASLEWRDALDTLPDNLKPAMVREAAGMGWYDQAIVTATRLGQFDDLTVLFPKPYERQVLEAADLSGIPPLWLYAVMRKESAFRPDAVSGAGAVGVLQMLPSTAAATAKAAGRPVPTAEQLKDPAVNIPLAALHLRAVLDKSEGRWQMALAAYNAGFRAVSRWRPPATMDADIWIENIPFNETRGYVQRILYHAAVYQWLEQQRPVRANNWLPPVEPDAAANASPDPAP